MNILKDYNLIKEILPKIKFKYSWENKNENAPYRATNLDELRSAVKKVAYIPILSDIHKAIKDSWLFETTQNELAITSNQQSELARMVSVLEIQLYLLKKIAEESNFFNQNDLLMIQMPEFRSFDELNRMSNDLKKSIEIPISNEEIEGDVNIIGGDKGSIILYVTLGSVMAVKLVAGICWAAAVIRKKKAEAKIFEEHAKTLTLKNESLSDLVDAQKIQLKNMINSEAEAIAQNHYSHSDQETVERLKLSVTTVADLIDRGVKILPTNNNDNIQNAFPDYERLNLIESAIKRIKDSNN